MKGHPVRRARADRRLFRQSLGFALAFAVVFGAALAGEPQPSQSKIARTLPMMSDPLLGQLPPEVLFDRANIALWLRAMQRPEFDTRVDAVEAVALAHRQGVRDLNEALPQIRKLLTGDSHAQVRLAAARALIELDDRTSAAALQSTISDASKVEAEFVLAIDRALAAWGHSDAIDVWIARLENRSAGTTLAISAIRSLGAVGAKRASIALGAYVTDRGLPAPVRIEAARALSDVEATGRSPLAVTVAAEPGSLGPLLALFILGSDQHGSRPIELDSDSLALTESLASHPDPRVRSHALALLRRADISRALAKSELLRDPDDGVRLEAVLALARAPISAPATSQLGIALNDVSEPVRVAARNGLAERWKEDSAGVQAVVQKALSGGQWREVQQAAILAGDFKIVAFAGQLAALLEFERPEVRLAAVTSLRILDVEESLPALMARSEKLTASAGESVKVPERLESEAQELTQIFMVFAQRRYAPSTAMLKKYIPKRAAFHPLARGAAIYALGKIFEASPAPELAQTLLGRAEDNNPVDPEAADVRRFAIIALGRMGARETLPALRDLYEAENSVVSVGGASRWAIMHLEAVDLPACRPVVKKAGPFFLESIGPAPAGQP